MPVPTAWHRGELEAQRARGFASDLTYTSPPYEPSLSPPQAAFFSQLHFLPLATLDAQGRPWASLVFGRGGTPDFIQAVNVGEGEDGEKGLCMRVPVPQGHPLRFCLPPWDSDVDDELAVGPPRATSSSTIPATATEAPKGTGGLKVLQDGAQRRLTAAVGLMLHNQRRNKMEGWIERWAWARTKSKGTSDHDSGEEEGKDELELVAGVSNTLGNCPKYINKRLLAPAPYDPVLLAPPPSGWTSTSSSFPTPGSTPASTPQSSSTSGLRSTPATPFDPTLAPILPRGTHLPTTALALLAAADLVFLATRCLPAGSSEGLGSPEYDKVKGIRAHTHTSTERAHMGMNSKGGRRGFVRHFFDEEAGRPCVVLPDFSGNRFMNSIGNLALDPLAGLAVPHFGLALPSSSSSGGGTLEVIRPTRILHLTGRARVLTGDAARRVMRGAAACIMIWVEGYSVVEGLGGVVDGRVGCMALGMGMGLDPRGRGDMPRPDGHGWTEEQVKEVENASVEWSPYNPPLRLLNSESPVSGYDGGYAGGTESERKAVLIGVEFWAHDLATFHWALPLLPSSQQSAPPYKAGQHVILDASPALSTRVASYTHMARFRGGERELNDDGVRSWSVSSAPYSPVPERSGEKGVVQFSTTVRLKFGGAATPGLFALARSFAEPDRRAAERDPGLDAPQPRVELAFLGFDGSFTLPPVSASKEHSGAQRRLLYMAHGIGVTPVLAHIEALARAAVQRSDATEVHGEAGVDVLIVLAARAHEVHVLEGLIRRSVLLGARSSGEDDTDTTDTASTLKISLILLTRPSTNDEEADLANARRMGVPTALCTPLPPPSTALPPNIVLSSAMVRGARVDDALFQSRRTIDANANAKKALEALSGANVASRAAYICGTPAFERACRRALRAVQDGGAGEGPQVVSESFAF